MNVKWVVVIFVVVVIPILTYSFARRTAKRDIEEAKEEMEARIGEDAWETIDEAKRWIEENNKEHGGEFMIKGINKHTLGELLALEPTEKEYRKYVKMVGEQIQKQYVDYQFFMYEPDKSDLVSGFMLQFQIMGHEPEYDKLFKYAMDTGLEMDKIDAYFFESLLAGEIIPIGEGIIVEEEGTGISPIKSGDDVRVIISFVTEEYKELQEEQEALEEKADE